jgi:hypothetical protein
MRQPISIVALLLTAVFLPGTFASASDANVPPLHKAHAQKLEGMEYLKARPIILSYGWKPVLGECEGAETSCGQYPEIDACSCCGNALCAMDFVRNRRCLVVGTIGGPPVDGQADTVVTDLGFVRPYRGLCPKLSNRKWPRR